MYIGSAERHENTIIRAYPCRRTVDWRRRSPNSLELQGLSSGSRVDVGARAPRSSDASVHRGRIRARQHTRRSGPWLLLRGARSPRVRRRRPVSLARALPRTEPSRSAIALPRIGPRLGGGRGQLGGMRRAMGHAGATSWSAIAPHAQANTILANASGAVHWTMCESPGSTVIFVSRPRAARACP